MQQDVLAKIRVVLWCPEKAWESGSDEIDRKLQDTCGDYWARSVLQGHNEKHPDGAWQDEAWQQATRRESTKKLRILERHLTKSGWFDAPPEPPDTLGGFDWSLMARMVRGLMAFWSDYSRRWKRIRAKIFLRSDLFRRHAGMGTADFAKLAANRADLTWSDGALLGMLAKRIANTSDGLAAYCRGARLKLEHHDALGLIPIVRDPRDAFPLLERLAGEFMGAERKKGFVRNWILAHLRDGNGLVSPRSLGRLFEQAAGKDAANQSVSPPRLIHPTALRQALDDVSDSHVKQGTSSEWPWLDGVRTRLQNDRLVPWEQRKITGLLAADWDGRWAPEAQSQVRPPEDRPADFVDYLTELGTSASAPTTAWMCPISTSPASTSVGRVASGDETVRERPDRLHVSRLEAGPHSCYFSGHRKPPCPQPSQTALPTLTLCVPPDYASSRYGFRMPDDRASPRSAAASQR